MDKDIYILGVGHNTIVYIDLVETCGYRVAGLYHYTPGKEGEDYFGHTIIGHNDELFRQDLTGKRFAISVGDNRIRAEIYRRIRVAGGEIPLLVHPSAVVSKYARIGSGTVVHANSVVSPDVTIGENCVISSNDMVAHGSRMGNHCFIASNAVLGAYVVMDDYAFIGSGATVLSGKVAYIGSGALVGAGAVVTKNVEPGVRVAGNPARVL